MDQGYDSARDFILRHFTPFLEEILKKGTWIDAKSLFQEQAQRHENTTPTYKTTKETGPDHDKHFTVGVFINDRMLGEGSGKSKQDAEQEAARNALVAQGWN